MIVLAIIQCWDKNDQVRGFTVGWMEKLADKVDKLIILTLEQRQPPTRSNMFIYSLGKENYQGFWRRFYYLWRWHKNFREILSKHQPDAVFTHMAPIYSVLAYPYARRQIPIFTWFLHPRVHLIVKLAHWLSTTVVSATFNSYPYKKDKLVALGHGIDTDLFVPNYSAKASPPLIISVGRISRVKNYETLLRAAQGIRTVIIGSPITDDDREYFKELKQYRAEFLPALPREELVKWYQKCFVHVNPTKPGSGDKVNLEAMACGRPSLMATSAFVKSLSGFEDKLIFNYQNEKDLSDKINYWLALPAAELEEFGKILRERVVKNHSLDKLMTNLVTLFSQ